MSIANSPMGLRSFPFPFLFKPLYDLSVAVFLERKNVESVRIIKIHIIILYYLDKSCQALLRHKNKKIVKKIYFYRFFRQKSRIFSIHTSVDPIIYGKDAMEKTLASLLSCVYYTIVFLRSQTFQRSFTIPYFYNLLFIIFITLSRADKRYGQTEKRLTERTSETFLVKNGFKFTKEQFLRFRRSANNYLLLSVVLRYHNSIDRSIDLFSFIRIPLIRFSIFNEILQAI